MDKAAAPTGAVAKVPQRRIHCLNGSRKGDGERLLRLARA
jgi:hypothetical protein